MDNWEKSRYCESGSCIERHKDENGKWQFRSDQRPDETISVAPEELQDLAKLVTGIAQDLGVENAADALEPKTIGVFEVTAVDDGGFTLSRPDRPNEYIKVDPGEIKDFVNLLNEAVDELSPGFGQELAFS